jgi:hypothetical protein
MLELLCDPRAGGAVLEAQRSYETNPEWDPPQRMSISNESLLQVLNMDAR